MKRSLRSYDFPEKERRTAGWAEKRDHPGRFWVLIQMELLALLLLDNNIYILPYEELSSARASSSSELYFSLTINLNIYFILMRSQSGRINKI